MPHANSTKGVYLSFTEETFDLMFGSPYLEDSLMIRVIYIPTGEIVAFTGGIPRKLAYKDQIYRLGIPTWQTVHHDHQRKGLAFLMNMEILRIAKERGIQCGFATYEPEAHGYDAMRKAAKEINMKVREELNIKKFIFRVLDPLQFGKVLHLNNFIQSLLGLVTKVKPVNNPHVRDFQNEDADRLFELMQDHITKNELAFVREKDDFNWYLQRPGVKCVVHEDESGQVDGFLLAWHFELAGSDLSIPFGWLDIVHIYRLSFEDATDLFKFLCIRCKEIGWAGLQTPYSPYFDHKPLRKAGFWLIPKTIKVVLMDLTPVDLPEKTNSFYFDLR
jgi:GNAT superfamily N-acetyltransferase